MRSNLGGLQSNVEEKEEEDSGKNRGGRRGKRHFNGKTPVLPERARQTPRRARREDMRMI